MFLKEIINKLITYFRNKICDKYGVAMLSQLTSVPIFMHLPSHSNILVLHSSLYYIENVYIFHE